MEVRCGKIDKTDTFFYTFDCKRNCTNTIKAGDEYKVVEICDDIIIMSNNCYDRFVLELKEFVSKL